MRKIILIFFILTYSLICNANQVLFVNKSKFYPIEARYKFCNNIAGSEPVCTDENNITIKAKSNVSIEPPDMGFIYIIDAIQKDNYGAIVSKGKYEWKDKVANSSFKICGSTFFNFSEEKNNVIITFDNYDGSGAIDCMAHGY